MKKLILLCMLFVFSALKCEQTQAQQLLYGTIPQYANGTIYATDSGGNRGPTSAIMVTGYFSMSVLSGRAYQVTVVPEQGSYYDQYSVFYPGNSPDTQFDLTPLLIANMPIPRPAQFPALAVLTPYTSFNGVNYIFPSTQTAGALCNDGNGNLSFGACNGVSTGVSSINGVPGAFTFSGNGVNCTSTTCTFTQSSAGVIPNTPDLLVGGANNTAIDSGVLPSSLAPLASPAFTATPTTPTAAFGTNTTQIASTAFVQGALAGSFPSKGIANSTGAAWSSSYGTSGNGSTVLLSDTPALTGTASFGNLIGNNSASTVTASKFAGYFNSIYGTLVLGSGSGATIEKTVSDSSPVIVASINSSTSATGDYFDTKDASGNLHSIVDNSLGIHGTTFNGVPLTTSGLATLCLTAAGYLPCPSGSSGFPFTLGSTSIAANSTNTALAGLTSLGINGNTTIANTSPSTPDGNANSGTLTFLANFYDLGPTPDSWTMRNVMGTGSTPTSNLIISKTPGGTTGAQTFTVFGSNVLQLSQNSSFMGNGAGGGISISPTQLTLNSNGPINLYPETGSWVVSNAPVEVPALYGFNGGSQVNLNAPVGGSGTFNQNLTAENGDIDVCPTGTPTITIGAGSGTGATSNILGDNCGGVITITTGSITVPQSTIFTLNFSNQFTHYGFCTFAPMRVTLQDGGITPDNVYMDTGYPDHFTLGLSGTGVMEVLSNHQWSYTCNGY